MASAESTHHLPPSPAPPSGPLTLRPSVLAWLFAGVIATVIASRFVDGVIPVVVAAAAAALVPGRHGVRGRAVLAAIAGLLVLFVVRMWPETDAVAEASVPPSEGGHPLSWILGMPIAGAVAILFMPRQWHRALQSTTLGIMAVTFALALPLLRAAMGRDVSLQRGRRVDAAVRHSLPRGGRRDLALARDAHRVHHADRGVRLVRVGQDAHQRLVLRAPPARGRNARLLSRARSVPLLRLLGADARPHVRHDRRMGRGGTHSKRHQVLPLHDVRLDADARSHPLHGLRLRAGQRRDAELRLLRFAAADDSASTCRCGCGLRSPSRSSSKCRCSRCTRGCPTRTRKRRRRARSSWLR